MAPQELTLPGVAQRNRKAALTMSALFVLVLCLIFIFARWYLHDSRAQLLREMGQDMNSQASGKVALLTVWSGTLAGQVNIFVAQDMLRLFAAEVASAGVPATDMLQMARQSQNGAEADTVPPADTASNSELLKKIAPRLPLMVDYLSDFMGSYGNAVWAGLTGEVTAFDPFRIAWDFNYGSVSYDDSRANRAGWLGSLLFEYKLDWAIPGLYGWYASGDDGNPANGSERMPSISVNNNNNGFSDFAFNGGPMIGREAVLGYDMSGTWGIGARLKDMSFIENLKHTFRLNLIGGTNSTTMTRYLTGHNSAYSKITNQGPNAQAAGMDLPRRGPVRFLHPWLHRFGQGPA